MEGCGCYKHSAPLEPGGDRALWVLQTFGSAGAGRRWRAAGATNIRLRWSREEMEGCGCYKHSAPLEPGGDRALRVLQTFGSAGAGKGMEGCGCCKHSVRWSQERNGGLGVLQTLGRWSRPPVAAGRI